MPGSQKNPPIEARVLAFIRGQELINPGETVLVAVSGGPDSVCLLHVLSELKGELGIRLHIAHLNHQLRGQESDDDAAYVAALAKKLGIPATLEARDVAAYRQQQRLSPEEAAREVRYAFLAEAAQSCGAARVAVGHTADDHVETVLMHLVHGSGPRGLRGLLPRSPWPYPGHALTVVRPLLDITRPETAAYCRRHRLNPRVDASNESLASFRNRVRHELLPLLRRYNPQVDGAIRRLAHLAADDLAFIEAAAAGLWGGPVRREGETVVFDRGPFLALPPALKRHLLRAAIEGLSGTLKDIGAGHIEDVIAALEKPSGKTIGLPGGLSFTIEPDRYVLAADDAAACPWPPLEGETALNVPGRTELAGWLVEAALLPPEEMPENNPDELTAYLDYAGVGDRLGVRHRRPGDRFQPLGLGGEKKLNQFMIDARIPRSFRGRVPVVTAGDKIVWVVGYRLDERFKVAAATRRVLRIKFNLK